MKGAMCIAALTLSPPILAGEVIDLRVGYWAVVYTLPDGSQQKGFDCYTQEELEGLRFFISTDENCTLLSGSQTRLKWEGDAVCGEGEQRMKMHVALQAPEPAGYTAVIRYEAEAKPPLTVNATGRWLQESCNISDIPIS
jgi:hypothetical protein